MNPETGWLDFPRPKTGIARRIPLWPETVAALREALARRYEPKDKADAGLLFITKRKTSWDKSAATGNHAPVEAGVGVQDRQRPRPDELLRGFYPGVRFSSRRSDQNSLADENYWNRHAIVHSLMRRAMGVKDSAKCLMAINFLFFARKEGQEE